mmetsp:Transcript_41790/g.71503  ORF Transcript_41790/g.71503 Transcript_41790/m.71503 type:complete len:212 (-) Transcript_41790:899-1534(-)
MGKGGGKGGERSVTEPLLLEVKNGVPAKEGAKDELVPKVSEAWHSFDLFSKYRWESPYSKWSEEKWKTYQWPTKGELKALIPAHCFKRSAMKVLPYMGRDVVHISLCFYIFHSVIGLSTEVPTDSVLRFVAWAAGWIVYGILQGACLSGLWVIGHECGHGAFSEYPLLNDTVGWVLHSLCLVPYFSWQYSHAKHHRRTNDLVDGEFCLRVE